MMPLFYFSYYFSLLAINGGSQARECHGEYNGIIIAVF